MPFTNAASSAESQIASMIGLAIFKTSIGS